MRSRFLSLLIGFCFVAVVVRAEDQPGRDPRALWEYGFGFGYAHFEQYPASNRFSNLFLPFPTFQYRGTVLRADDREGAHAYLFKTDRFRVEFSGAGYPALASEENDARKGMDDLPWMLAVGPEAVAKITDDLEFHVGFFPALSTDFQMTRVNGAIYQTQLTYRWESELSGIGFIQPGTIFGRVFLTLKGGSRDFNKTYYEVPGDQTTAERPSYDAKAGWISKSISYFQSFNSGRAAFYIGAEYADYMDSANRASPLFKSNGNLSYLAGLTYVLGESRRPEVPIEETRGAFNRKNRSKSEPAPSPY